MKIKRFDKLNEGNINFNEYKFMLLLEYGGGVEKLLLKDIEDVKNKIIQLFLIDFKRRNKDISTPEYLEGAYKELNEMNVDELYSKYRNENAHINASNLFIIKTDGFREVGDSYSDIHYFIHNEQKTKKYNI